MTVRLTENYLNASGGIFKSVPSTDDQGRLLAFDGSELTGLPPANVAIDNDFDSFKVIEANSNITAEGGVLYLVSATCTINLPSPTFTGEKIGFIIVNSGVTLSLVTNVGSGGSALRTVISEIAYASSVANNEYYKSSSGSTFTLTGQGKSLYIIGIKTNDVLGYPAWVERSCRPRGSHPFATTSDFSTGTSQSALPNALNFLSPTTTGFFLYSSNGNVLQTATSSTQTGTGSLSDTLNQARGFRQQLYVISIGLSAVTTTTRTGQVTFSITSSSQTYWAGQNLFLRSDGRGHNLPVGYGTEGSINIKFSDTSAGVTFQQLKLADGSFTRANHLFDRTKNTAGVLEATDFFGAEAYFSSNLKKWFSVYHFGKANK
jgi:hypothetical protein